MDGFYDGDGVYKIRLMPLFVGNCTFSIETSFPGGKGVRQSRLRRNGLIDGAFGIDQEQFKQLLLAKEILDQVDVFLLCQGSMAYAEEFLHEVTGKPVVSSPRFGTEELRKRWSIRGCCNIIRLGEVL